MRWLTAFGEFIAESDPHRQAAEIQTRIVLINRFNAPRPRRGCPRCLTDAGKGPVRLKPT